MPAPRRLALTFVYLQGNAACRAGNAVGRRGRAPQSMMRIPRICERRRVPNRQARVYDSGLDRAFLPCFTGPKAPTIALLPVCCRRSIVWGAKAKPPVLDHL